MRWSSLMAAANSEVVSLVAAANSEVVESHGSSK